MMAPVLTGVGTKAMAKLPPVLVGLQTKAAYDNLFNPAKPAPVPATIPAPNAQITQQAQLKQEQIKAAVAQGGAAQNMNPIQQIDT